ncbi:MAG: preprotein translocase subunit YajC [Mycobacteriaceae bacterium]
MELLFPLILVGMLAFMFFGMRKQRKMQAETIAMQDSLAVGDRVQTTSGMHATVAGVAEETVDLEIAPGVVTTWVKLAIRDRFDDQAAAEQKAEEAVASGEDLDSTKTFTS